MASVHIISGFLGTGKTTTLVKLLQRRPSGERVAVVVNDFGKSAVDKEALTQLQLEVAEIDGACVCCTAPAGFSASVGKLLDVADRIFVEPTGLARPADLIDTLRRGPWADRVEVAPLVVLVDPKQIADPQLHGVVAEQAAVADHLVVNRMDCATDDEAAGVDTFVAELWPGPLSVVRTSHGEVGDEILGWPDGTGPRSMDGGRSGHSHGHDHDFSVSSPVWPPDVHFHRDRLGAVLGELPRLVRAKGMMRTEEGTLAVQLASGKVTFAVSPWRRDSRLDLIFQGELPDGIDTALAGAVLGEAERDRRGRTLELALPDGRSVILGRKELMALPDGVPDVEALVPGRRGAAARVSQLLSQAAAPSDVDAVVVAADGYATPPVPVDALGAGVLVHSLDGGPLPGGKGGPFRLLIPGDAGPGGPCANVKGVVRIALRPRG